MQKDTHPLEIADTAIEKETENADPVEINIENPEEHSDIHRPAYVVCDRCGKRIRNHPIMIKDHERDCIQKEILDTIDEIEQKTPETPEVELKPPEITDYPISDLEGETEEQEPDSNAGFFSNLNNTDVIVILGIIGALFAALVIIPAVKVTQITQTQQKQPDPAKAELDLALQALKNGPTFESMMPLPLQY